MEAEEINGLLWEEMAGRSSAVTADQLCLATGLERSRVLSGLTRLRQANLLLMEAGPAYRADLALDALRWAQAVGLGVSLTALEKHARLSSSARAEALRLATDGSVERVESGVREEKRKKRMDVLQGRAASRAAATDLAQILKDTELALRGSSKVKSGRKKAVANLLKQANEEAQRALDGLVKTLGTQ